MPGSVEPRTVVVVGAGPNGLSAGVALARAGLDVEIHEARRRVGGAASSEELTLPGFVHDVGSAVHPMGICSPFFRSLDLARYGLEWIAPPIAAAHPFDDGTAAVLARDLAETGASLGAIDAHAYAELLGPLVRRWEELYAEVLAPPLHVPSHPILLARFGAIAMRTATGLARDRFAGSRARALFVGTSAHALLRMNAVPSAAFGLLLHVAAHAEGWPIPRGGAQRISDALAGVLGALGGGVVTSSRVASLRAFDDAAAIVLDVTPRQVLAMTDGMLPPRYRRTLGRWKYAPGVFKIDWALSAPIPWTAEPCRRALTLHLGGSAEEIARSARAAWNGDDDRDPFVILAQPTLFDATRAPPGRHVAWAYCHVPNGSTFDMTARIEAQVERFAPGFRELVLARHTMTTRELERWDENLVGGDIDGGVSDVLHFVFRPSARIDPYATPNPRVFLCSASTPPGGAVHGMCGYNAARSVLTRLRSASASSSRAAGAAGPG